MSVFDDNRRRGGVFFFFSYYLFRSENYYGLLNDSIFSVHARRDITRRTCTLPCTKHVVVARTKQKTMTVLFQQSDTHTTLLYRVYVKCFKIDFVKYKHHVPIRSKQYPMYFAYNNIIRHIVFSGVSTGGHQFITPLPRVPKVFENFGIKCISRVKNFKLDIINSFSLWKTSFLVEYYYQLVCY